MKICNNKINANFYDNKMLECNDCCICNIIRFCVQNKSWLLFTIIFRIMQICNRKEKDNEHN